MKHTDSGHNNPALNKINSRTGRNMPQAIATGALLVALIVASLLFKPDAFMLLVICFMSLGLWELRVDFAIAGLHIPIVVLWVGSAVTMLLMFYSHDRVTWMIVGVFITIVIATICASFQNKKSLRLERAMAGKRGGSKEGEKSNNHERSKQNSNYVFVEKGRYANVAVTLLTVLYITFLACLIVFPVTIGEHPVAHGMMSIFLPAISDIGGLAFGAWIGKHKLSPRISPKKSVEGLLGSMGSSVVAAMVIFACTYPQQEWSTIWWVPLIMGILVGATGTFGDLSASLIKRDLGIKDMGHLLKGHGGVLDRVDSILMSAPFITALLWVTGL